jgi:hypothetical protein
MNRRNFLKGLIASVVVAAAPSIAWAKSKLRRIKIFSEDDFPKSVDGVITLEENTVYELQNTITTNKLIMGRNTVISGKGRGVSYNKELN